MNPIEARVKNLKNSYNQKYTFRDEQFKEGYKAAINDVLAQIKKATPELLVVGGEYYVVIYENGHKSMAYYKKMILINIRVNPQKGTTFCFSNIDNKKKKIDFTLSSVKIHDRVFFTEEQAKRACG